MICACMRACVRACLHGLLRLQLVALAAIEQKENGPGLQREPVVKELILPRGSFVADWLVSLTISPSTRFSLLFLLVKP
ncbi:uncharacterized protein GGS25DRAFT_490964, partial [Hypoxylon fragiforme]|uniref:uncharacterized protein n=1 Tax=Hypoxylon fragiforme TaxID=63214 RepID=UPI0020C6D984